MQEKNIGQEKYHCLYKRYLNVSPKRISDGGIVLMWENTIISVVVLKTQGISWRKII
jgi:hypothetical protein